MLCCLVAVMENSTGAVVNSIEVQIDNFLEDFKRTSKAMEEHDDAGTNEGESPLVRRSSANGGGSGSGRRRGSSNSRPMSMGVFEGKTATNKGFDCQLDSNSEGQYYYFVLFVI